MSKAMLYAAVSLAVALPFAAQAKSKPASSDSAAPASSSATPDSATTSTAPAEQAAPAQSTAPSSAAPPSATPPDAAGSTAAAPGATPGASANAATGTSTDANATAAAFTVGAPVKDNTGATIGSISELKPGPSGVQMATISMGQDKFSVATTGLAMQNGAAVINMTQAELQAQLHPAAPK